MSSINPRAVRQWGVLAQPRVARTRFWHVMGTDWLNNPLRAKAASHGGRWPLTPNDRLPLPLALALPLVA